MDENNAGLRYRVIQSAKRAQVLVREIMVGDVTVSEEVGSFKTGAEAALFAAWLQGGRTAPVPAALPAPTPLLIGGGEARRAHRPTGMPPGHPVGVPSATKGRPLANIERDPGTGKVVRRCRQCGQPGHRSDTCAKQHAAKEEHTRGFRSATASS